MSSSKPDQEALQHFSHIHPLTLVTGRKFICDGCNRRGNGTTYHCVQCDYDLHDYCATCPPSLVIFKHPQHVLQLVFNGPKHICDICDGSVEGLYYRCKVCDFLVHSLCPGLPQHVSHEQARPIPPGMVKRLTGPDHAPQPAHMESVKSPTSAEKRIPRSKPKLHPTQCHPNHGCGCGHPNQGQSKRKIMFGFLTDITAKVVTKLISSSLDSNHHHSHHHHSNHHDFQDYSDDVNEDYSDDVNEHYYDDFVTMNIPMTLTKTIPMTLTVSFLYASMSLCFCISIVCVCHYIFSPLSVFASVILYSINFTVLPSAIIRNILQ